MKEQERNADSWRCPVCEETLGTSTCVCPSCGYDRSTDYTIYCTFARIGQTAARDGKCTQRGTDGSITVGTKIKGIWNGPFKQTFPDGSYLEGTYVNGKIEGMLTNVDAKGATTVGMYHNGWNGPFTQTFPTGTSMEGVFVNGKVEGFLKQIYQDGRIWEGQWHNGNWNGPCKETFASGGVREGTKINGIWDGLFTTTWPSGIVYVGTQKGTEIVGPLEQRDGKGNIFTCEWSNNSWNGLGKYKYADGSVLTATWVNGNVPGDGKITYTNGSVYEGGIENFQPHGAGIIRFDHAVLRGTFHDGKPAGTVTIDFSDGGKYIGHWDNAINGQGTFASRSYPDFFEVSYSGRWRHNSMDGNGGTIRVCTAAGEGAEFCGEFVHNKISGNGILYFIQNGEKEPIAQGTWAEGKLVGQMTSLAIKESEVTILKALERINTTLAALR